MDQDGQQQSSDRYSTLTPSCTVRCVRNGPRHPTAELPQVQYPNSHTILHCQMCEEWTKMANSRAPTVCHSLHRGEYLGRYPPLPGRYTPRDQVPPPRTRYTPWDQVHPPEQCMLGDTGNKWAVHILLECIPVLITNTAQSFSVSDFFLITVRNVIAAR